MALNKAKTALNIEDINVATHNAFLDLLYQIYSQIKEIEEMKKSLDKRFNTLAGTFNAVTRYYPKSEEYIKQLKQKAEKGELRLNLYSPF